MVHSRMSGRVDSAFLSFSHAAFFEFRFDLPPILQDSVCKRPWSMGTSKWCGTIPISTRYSYAHDTHLTTHEYLVTTWKQHGSELSPHC
jgi:hypothetical protein